MIPISQETGNKEKQHIVYEYLQAELCCNPMYLKRNMIQHPVKQDVETKDQSGKVPF